MASTTRFRRRIACAIVALPVLIFIYVTAGLFIVHRKNGVEFSYRNAGTDLVFESSSGHWTAEEDLIRGRHFEHIVLAHELYKIHCNRPGASLARTKSRKNPWNWAFWFDDYDELKWRVPYMPGAKSSTHENCSDKPATVEEVASAEQATREYLTHLARR